MTDPFGMTDAELIQRYRRALAEIMTGIVEIEVYHAASRALFGDCVSIQTERDPPPMPDPRYDWSAIDAASYDVGDPVGEGETEVDAILDLLDKLEERE